MARRLPVLVLCCATLLICGCSTIRNLATRNKEGYVGGGFELAMERAVEGPQGKHDGSPPGGLGYVAFVAGDVVLSAVGDILAYPLYLCLERRNQMKAGGSPPASDR